MFGGTEFFIYTRNLLPVVEEEAHIRTRENNL